VRHLVADWTVDEPMLLQSAAVITRHDDTASAMSLDSGPWADRILEEYRGCRHATVVDTARNRVLVFRRGDAPLLVGAAVPSGVAVDPALFASVAYACEVKGLLLIAGGAQVILHAGNQRLAVKVEPAAGVS
jgi:hypothetical protein